jgi:hypothetical protein
MSEHFGGDGARGFARARGGDEARCPPLASNVVPLENTAIAGDNECGKTLFLQWLLMFHATVAILRETFEEVVLICSACREGTTSGWQWFRQLHRFEPGSDVSPDGFFRVYATMTTEIWEREIR